MTRQTASELYDERRQDIARVMDWIELELESPDVLELTGLAGVREKMIDALAEISGTGPDEIQRNLDELRM